MTNSAIFYTDGTIDIFQCLWFTSIIFDRNGWGIVRSWVLINRELILFNQEPIEVYSLTIEKLCIVQVQSLSMNVIALYLMNLLLELLLTKIDHSTIQLIFNKMPSYAIAFSNVTYYNIIIRNNSKIWTRFNRVQNKPIH